MVKCQKCGKVLTPAHAGHPCPECGSFDREGVSGDQASAKESAARELARRHYQVEAGLTRVFRLTGSAAAEMRPSEPIKLLEVNAATVPSGVMPLHFGPAPASGIPFPSVIVEVTPAEFDKIRTEEIKLPKGWVIGEEIARPIDAGES